MTTCITCWKDRGEALTGYACETCETQMRGWLADLPGFQSEAAGKLLPSSNGEKVRTSDRTIGISVAALDVATGLPWVETLHAWTRLVEEERELSTSPKWPDGGVAAALRWHVDFLTRHLEWLCVSFPAVDDFHHEIHDLWASGARVCVERDRVQRFRVQCPGCDAVITFTPEDAAADVTCHRCGETRPLLFLMAAADEDAWADPESITEFYGMPARTLRSWAQRGLVRRRGNQYSVADVRRTRTQGA